MVLDEMGLDCHLNVNCHALCVYCCILRNSHCRASKVQVVCVGIELFASACFPY